MQKRIACRIYTPFFQYFHPYILSLLLFTFFFKLLYIEAVLEFQGYRLIQYELDGKLLGSWRTSFNAVMQPLTIHRTNKHFFSDTLEINKTSNEFWNKKDATNISVQEKKQENIFSSLFFSHKNVYLMRIADIYHSTGNVFENVLRNSAGVIIILPKDLKKEISSLLSSLVPVDLRVSFNDTTSIKEQGVKEDTKDKGKHDNYAKDTFSSIYNQVLFRLKNMEKYLMQQKHNVAIYFVFENEDVLNIYNSVNNIESEVDDCEKNDVHGCKNVIKNQRKKKNQNIFSNFYSKLTFVVNYSPPQKIQNPYAQNVMGWLFGKNNNNFFLKDNFSSTASVNKIPTIAIVAQYDTFSAAPSLAIGANSNGSGLIVALELLRLFSMMYSSIMSLSSNYNLVFIFSSAGIENFKGIESWLAKTQPFLLDSIEFALCLDSLLEEDYRKIKKEEKQNETLYLHFSKQAEDRQAKKFVKALENAGLKNKVNIYTKQRDVNIQHEDILWQHEHFSKYKIISGTLSRLADSTPFHEKYFLFDYDFSEEACMKMIRVVRIVADALAHHIFNLTDIGHQNIEIFKDYLAPSKLFIKAWQKLLFSHSRFYPLMNLEKNVFLRELQSIVETNSHKFDVFTFPVENDKNTYYYDEPFIIKAMYVRSPIFDLFHLLLNALYLLLLYTLLKGKDSWIILKETAKSFWLTTSPSKMKLK